MTLRQMHRLAVSRNQPVIVALRSWDLDFKAQIWITPHGKTWARKRDGTRYEARFSIDEALSNQWYEVLYESRNSLMDGLGSSTATDTDTE